MGTKKIDPVSKQVEELNDQIDILHDQLLRASKQPDEPRGVLYSKTQLDFGRKTSFGGLELFVITTNAFKEDRQFPQPPQFGGAVKLRFSGTRLRQLANAFGEAARRWEAEFSPDEECPEDDDDD